MAVWTPLHLWTRLGSAEGGREVIDVRPEIRRVVVVVPVHNEELLLDACLSALGQACERVGVETQVVETRVIVVLDSCTDSSLDIARTWSETIDASVVSVDRRNVGAARAAGFLAAFRDARVSSYSDVWFATTDADSEVGGNWLSSQLAHARRGARVVAGTVTPDSEGVSPALALAYNSGYRHQPGHRHVHGANLGFRADAYWSVGGFGALATAEDVDLVGRLEHAGIDVLYASDGPVRTSSRRVGRAPDGFAGHLRDLELAIAL